MTIGEKIKYLRKQRGLTQDQLAYKAGLHTITIRKYEAGQRTPRIQQIESLANALDINAIALQDMDFRFETVGDIMGIITILYHMNVISIAGERNEDTTLKADTLRIHLSSKHPLFSLISVYINGQRPTSLNEITIAFHNEVLVSELIKLENAHYLLSR